MATPRYAVLLLTFIRSKLNGVGEEINNQKRFGINLIPNPFLHPTHCKFKSIAAAVFIFIPALASASESICVGSDRGYGWYTSNPTIQYYESAEAACSSYDMSLIGYPHLTYAYTTLFEDGRSAQCWHRQLGPAVNIINTAIRCIDDYTPANNEVNKGQSPNNTCNPVNIGTGNKYFKVVDYSGEGFHPLEVVRHYNSFNQGWGFNYRQALSISSNVSVPSRAYRPDGQVLEFYRSGSSFWSPLKRTEVLKSVGNFYELTLNNNKVERYDSEGKLISIQELNGELIELEYAAGNVSVIKDQQQLTLHLNGVGQVVRVALPDTTEISYSYDTFNELNRLKAVFYPDSTPGDDSDNPRVAYFFEDPRYPHYITGFENEIGERVSSVSYDASGRALSSEKSILGSGIMRTEFFYHADGSRTLTNSLGKQNTYHFADINGELKMTQVEGHQSANCAAANQSYTYDANGFKDLVTDWEGNITDYDHDARGLEVKRTEAKGTPQQRVITTQWHADYRLPVKITEPDRVIEFSYDAQGLLLERKETPVP